MKYCKHGLKRIFTLALTGILVCTSTDMSGLTVSAAEPVIVEETAESVMAEDTTEFVTVEDTADSVTMENVTENVSVYEEKAKTITVVEEIQEQNYVSDVDLPENDELFAGYVDKAFYGEDTTYGGIVPFSVSAREQLSTDAAKALYDYLKTQITAVANGTQASTNFSFDASAMGVKVSFTAEDLGVDSLVVEGSIPKDVVNAAWDAFWNQFEMAILNDALLHDCPYELYWYDKTIGSSWGCSVSATSTILTMTNPYVSFSVAGTYQADGYNAKNPATNTIITGATSVAVNNANAIVTEYADKVDYEKLIGYRDEICELVTYDHDAAEAGNFSENDNPWQLIYVFDGDTSTNVVCEGYSKAFQYLCDQTEFSFDISCYTVSGVMSGGTGGGAHMWNTVTMEDGKNYLVDITNSDSGSIGQNGGLFLAGTSGSIASGYIFPVGYSKITFTYDNDMIVLWGSGEDSILALAASDYEYVPGVVLPVISSIVEPSETAGTLTETTAQVSFTGNVAGTYYYIVKESSENAPASINDFATLGSDGKWSPKDGVTTGTMTADANNTISLSGLLEGTDYTVYIAATDTEGNSTGSKVIRVSFTTIGAGEVHQIDEDGSCSECGGKILVEGLENYTYTGEEVIPSVLVKWMDASSKETILIEGVDYYLTYQNNVKAGTATVTITYTKNFKGSVNKNFTILPASMEDATIIVDDTLDLTYDGTAKEPSVAIFFGEALLTASKDYTLNYVNNIHAGEATVTITGKGNFTGMVTSKYIIDQADAESAMNTGKLAITLDDTELIYTGQKLAPVVSISDVAGTISTTDYELVCENNINAGSGENGPKLKLKFADTADYSGEISKNFTIEKAPLLMKADDISVSVGSKLPEFTYTVTGLVNDETQEVLETKPSLSCPEADMDTAGDYTIEIQGKDVDGNYSIQYKNGTLTVHEKTDISEQIYLTAEDITYGNEPDVTAEFEGKGNFVYTYSGDEGITYSSLDELRDDNGFLPVGSYVVKVIYEDNTQVGVKTADFKVVGIDISDAEVIVAGSCIYNAMKQTPVIAVRLDGKLLTNNEDYKLSYADKNGDVPDFINAGEIIITITGMGNYEGTAEGSFVIEPKAVEVNADNATRKYGEANPEFTFTVPEGTLEGTDTEADLNIRLETTATVTSPVKEGGYPIIGNSTSTNYAVTVVPGVLTIEKAEAQINIVEGKENYHVTYGDADFSLLDGMELIGEGTPVYTISNGMEVDGQPKNVEDIVTVSEGGMVTIVGSGSVTVTISMATTQNYTAAEPKTISIVVSPMDENDERKTGFFISDIEELTYIGKAMKPEPKVYDGVTGIQLKKGTDYTFSYKNNTNAYTLTEGEKGFDEKKAPTLIIKGKGNYSSTLTVYFTIQPKDISNLTDKSIVVAEIVLEANGKVQKKVPSITYNQKKLSGVLQPADGSVPAKVKDFIYSYPQLDAEETKDKAFKDNGRWKIHVKGTGNYSGERDVYLTITGKGTNLAKATIQRIPSQEFDGINAVVLDETELVVTAKVNGEKTELVKDTHYEVRYENNTGIGTATVVITGKEGSGFAGTKKATFKITGTSIANAKVEGLVNKVYNGSEQTQDLSLTLLTKTGGGKNVVTDEISLMENTDFVVEYDKNINVGTAKLTIRGIGIYTGTIKKTFKITPYDMTGETDAKGNVKEDSLLTEANGLFEMANGELQVKYLKGGCKPEVILIFDGEELTDGKDYTISYKNNGNVYTLTEGDEDYSVKKAPTITIKGKGNFKGSITKTFTITGRSLRDADLRVSIDVADKAESSKAGGYISKPILTDKDGKVLKQGKDYTTPVYTIMDENGKPVTLTKKDQVKAGTTITVSVTGLGAYADESEEPLSTTYRITKENFGSVKVAGIQKEFTGSEIELTAADFLNEDGTSKVTFTSKTNKAELVYGKDFEIVENSYKNHIRKGTASVTLRGKGEYGGTKTIKFQIKAKGLFWWWLN